MRDKEEISKLRDKLRQNRKTFSQTTIESRLYGSPEATGYVNELNTSLNSVKDTLNQFGEYEEE